MTACMSVHPVHAWYPHRTEGIGSTGNCGIPCGCSFISSEMAQQWRELAALLWDPGSVPCNYMVVKLSMMSILDLIPFSKIEQGTRYIAL